jgi:hypothetical protein
MPRVSPSGGGIGPVAVVHPPPDRDSLLGQVLPERQKLYRLVRRVLDELDEAAPWEQLYYAPDDAETFLGMTAALIGVVEQIPVRTRELIAMLSLAAPDDETRQTLEEAEFYFSGIHSMCAHDLGRLRALLEPFAVPGAEPPPPRQRTFVCEVAADLKGKYASALMGATASILAEGQWSGVDVEPILFPEKAEEFRRNADLARALSRTIDAIGELELEVPFAELLARWRAGGRVDPYALADLAAFRGVLGRLLKRDLRRGFYSGDYHQIQRREAALATRMAALEATHHRAWSERGEGEEAGSAAEACRELQRLTLEIAAVLDVALLERLVGSRTMKDLRAAVASDGAVNDTAHRRRQPLLPELEALVPLLAGEDLKTFLALLLGSVQKRSSLSRAPRPAPAAVTEARRARRSGTAETAPAAVTTRHPAAPPPSTPAPAHRAARPRRSTDRREETLPSIDDALPGVTAATPPPSAPPAPGGAHLSAGSPAAADPAKLRETLEGLHHLLQSLQSNDNPHWSSFRMLQRLLARHARIPPSIVQGAHPFVFDVLNGLVPQLEAAASYGAVPQEARRRLVECCTALTDDRLNPEQMIDEVPAHLSRLHRLLEALAAATVAQLRALSPG